MLVELVFERNCPNIEAARAQLLKAFQEAKITPHWQEWEVSNPGAPESVLGYGSPTILVNGKDVCGESPAENVDSCRIYTNPEGGYSGVPALSDVAEALKLNSSKLKSSNEMHHICTKRSRTKKGATEGGQARKPWRLNTAMLPAIGIAVLPKLTCPACWPAYAGLLSAMGLGYIDYTPYLMPLMLAFLAVALATLLFRAKHRHGYSPFLLGLGSSIAMLTGKFIYESDVTMYAGLTLLVVASAWNSWPKSSPPGGAHCTSCAPADF